MRDMNRRELKKLHDTKSGQAAGTTHESKWQYFTSMSFVNALKIPQPTLSNVPTAENKKPLYSCKSGHTCRIKGPSRRQFRRLPYSYQPDAPLA